MAHHPRPEQRQPDESSGDHYARIGPWRIMGHASAHIERLRFHTADALRGLRAVADPDRAPALWFPEVPDSERERLGSWIATLEEVQAALAGIEIHAWKPAVLAQILPATPREDRP